MKYITLTALIALASSSIACGYYELDRMKGTWTYESGTYTLSCPGYAPDTTEVSGSVRFDEGSETDLTIVANTCVSSFNATATGAEWEPGGLPCVDRFNDSEGRAWEAELQPGTWSFRLNDAEDRLTEQYQGSLVLSSGAFRLTCGVNQNGVLRKVSR